MPTTFSNNINFIKKDLKPKKKLKQPPLAPQPVPIFKPLQIDNYNDYGVPNIPTSLNQHNPLTIFYYGTARDTRYARRVAFLSLFNIAQQIVYPPQLLLYRFSRSRIPIELSSNPLKSSTTAVHSYQFYESDTCSSSVRI